MIREIEKKYHLNTTDIEIIEQKCELISDKIVVDKYLDTPDYKVSKM